jgi:hypothetical protein
MSQLAGFVSCDIVGHSAEGVPAQRERIAAINDLVRATIARHGKDRVVWASGGDGGHVALFLPRWTEAAVRFLLELRSWSIRSHTPLRVNGHCGEVERIEGADGRVQLVGNGINLAGILLEYGAPGRIVVSEAFAAALAEAPIAGVSCHDERLVHPPRLTPRKLFLLSAEGPALAVPADPPGDSFRSAWDPAPPGDRERLQEAAGAQRGWEAIYHAKRLLQVNRSDGHAGRFLNAINPMSLTFDHPATGERELNPFLGFMDKPTRLEFVRSAELVEREAGDVLCHHDDDGNTMFVILKGEVGIYLPAAGDAGGRQPDFRMKQGDIVGELAVALNRKRTATMRALSRTALLSFHFSHFQGLTRKADGPAAGPLTFLNRRALEHICHNVGYLIGKDKSGPLAGLPDCPEPWEWLVQHATRLACSWGDTPVLGPDDAIFQADGLYLLAGGDLRATHNPRKLLEGKNLSVLHAAFPGELVSANQAYAPQGDVILFHIAAAGLRQFGPEVFSRVLWGIKTALARQFQYDVFLSYNFNDLATVRRWRTALEQAGLTVFMDDTSRKGHLFPPALAAGLLDSLVLLPLISANTMRRPLEENWVYREIKFRKDSFETNTANILPVKLPGEEVQVLADGYAAIDAIGREEEAIQEAIEAIRTVRQEPPIALQRKRGAVLWSEK